MKLFWDTNLFIYLWERKSFVSEIEELRSFIKSGEHSLATSSLTLAEILVQPMKMGRTDLIAQYRRALSALEIVSFDLKAAGTFARIRADFPSIRPPDAIQLACASNCRSDLFLTNDERLCEVSVPGIAAIRSLKRWRDV